jgi:hypothetical protein
VEDSETILSCTMGSIVSELSKFNIFGADVGVQTSANSCLLHIIPVTISI